MHQIKVKLFNQIPQEGILTYWWVNY